MRTLLKLLSWVSLGGCIASISAQTVTLTGSFTGTTLDAGWTVGGSGYVPTLTAPLIDAAGSGWLQLTTAGTNQATYALNTTSFVSKNATITASFNYVSYGGNGADGITFFLADASATFGVGAYGGSLGYAQKTLAGGATDINGMNGGYIGLGIDEFGNYANNSEGRVGGFDTNTATMTPDAVSIRGPGTGLTGYDYLGGTSTLPASLDTPGTGVARPTVTTFQVIITATNQLTVYMDRGATGTFTALYNIDLSGYTRPDSLVMGFTGSTGASTNIHEVQAVALSSVVANLWTNANGDSQWGTGNDWYGSPSGSVPLSYADILLDNTYVSTAQTVDVASNRLIRSLQLDAPFGYTLDNGTLTFNRGGIAGPSGIFVSQTHGSATQTINSALALNNAVQIQNNSSGALNLNGAIATNGNGIEFNGSGATTATGIVSGGGALTQTGAGTTTLSGANTYSGGTAISVGTLNANHATALGTAGVTLSGGTLGSTNASTVGNAVALTGSAGLSGLTTSGTLTQTGGSYTLAMAGATQTGAVNLSNSTTARTLTVQVDSGTSTIAGVIANGGGSTGGNLTKTGAGTLALSGTNTYSGTTTISAGTIQLGASHVLADSSTLNIAGGNLDLNGNSDKVGNLTFSNSGTINFGATAGNNSFVFGNITPTPTGVLTINNYVGPDSGNFGGTGDFLGTTTASLSATLLNQIYFSGYGTGSLENTTQTDAGNSLGNAYRIAPKVIDWTLYTWISNSSTSWKTNGNWSGNAKPPNNANPTDVFVDFGTGTQTAVSIDTSSTINALRFDSSAPAYTITDSGTRTLTFQNGTSLVFVQQQSANNQTLSPANILIKNNMVFDITGAGDLTVGAVIGDGTSTYSLTKTGSGGKLILTNSNTYDGGTNIQAGVIQAQNSGAFGTGAVTIYDGAALNLAGGITPTNIITITGNGMSGNGAVRNISGTNTLSGTLTLSGDSRVQSDTGTLTLSGNVTGSGKNLTVGGAGNTTVSGTITTGVGGVTKDGAGTLTYSGGSANTYTGNTTVNAGTLALSKTASIVAVAGNLVVNAGTVNQTTSGQIATTKGITLNGGTYNLDGTGSVTQTIQSLDTTSGSTVNLGTSDTLTVSGTGISTASGTITGTGALVTAGTGSVYLGGANTYSGGTTVGSVVTAAHSTSLGTGAATINSGGNLQIQGGVTLANAFTISGPGTTANDGAIENFSGSNSVSGNITLAANSRIQSSSGTLTLSNAGTLTGAGKNLTFGGAGNTIVNRNINTGAGTLTKEGTGTLTLGVANSYTGATSLNAGTTRLGVANAFSSSASITVATGAVLDLNGYAQTATSLLGGGGTAGGSIEFGGGTLTLSGTANSFGGDFGFSNGTIVLNAGVSLTLTDSFNAANINIVLNGGTLNLGSGLTQTFGSLTVTGTGTSVIDFGTTGATSAQFSSVNVTGTGTLSVTDWTNVVDYFLVTTSPGAQGTSPINKVVFSGGYVGNDTKWLPYGGGGNGQLTPVPEPSTYGVIFLGGAAGLVLWSRRRRSAKSKA